MIDPPFPSISDGSYSGLSISTSMLKYNLEWFLDASEEMSDIIEFHKFAIEELDQHYY